MKNCHVNDAFIYFSEYFKFNLKMIQLYSENIGLFVVDGTKTEAEKI